MLDMFLVDRDADDLLVLQRMGIVLAQRLEVAQKVAADSSEPIKAGVTNAFKKVA